MCSAQNTMNRPGGTVSLSLRTHGLACLAASLLLMPSAPASAEDGDLYYGPQGRLTIQALAADTTAPTYGPAPADVIAHILEPVQTYIDTDYREVYSALGFDFDYTLGPTPPALHPGVNWPFWAAMFLEQEGNISDRIQILTFAWLATGNVAARDKGTAMVMDLAQWPVWHDPEHACLAGPSCLDNAHAAIAVAYHYDAVRSTLDPTTRAAMRQALIEKALIPLADAVSQAATSDPEHNIVGISVAALGIGAAAILGEDDRALAWMEMALDVAQRYLEFQDPNGALVEMHGYGASGMDNILRLAMVAENVGVAAPHAPVLDHLAQFYAAALAPNGEGLGTFGDSWSNSAAASMFYLAARGDTIAQGYLVDSGLIAHQDFVWVRWARGDMEPARLGPYPYAAPYVGFAALRSDPGPTETLVVFKSGPRDAELRHNQHDHLSYQLWHWGHWVTGDPGYAIETQPPEMFQFYENALGHSTILVDGEGPQKKSGAALQRWAGGRGYGLMCGNATGTYGALTVTNVGRCIALHPWGFAVAFDAVDAPVARNVSLLHHPDKTGNTRMDSGGNSVGVARARLDVALPAANWVATEVDIAKTRGFPTSLVLTKTAAVGTDLPFADAGFEAGDLAAWTPRFANHPSHIVDGTTAASGAFSAKITSGAGSGGFLYGQALDVTPGSVIRLQGQVRTTNISGEGAGARLRALFYGASGYVGDLTTQAETKISGWHVKALTGQVPPDTLYMRFAFEVSGAGSAWFDDAEILILDESAAQITRVRTATLLYPAAEPDPSNASFTRGLTDWTPRYANHPSHAVDTTVYRSAPASARVHYDTSNGGYLYAPHTPVEPGESVAASVWIKADNLVGAGGRLRLLFYGAGVYLSDALSPDGEVTGTVDWQLRSLTATAPAGATTFRVTVDTGGSGTLWFDDFTLPDGVLVPTAEQVARPAQVAGGENTLTFTRNGVPFTVANATGGPLNETTANGMLSLDDGFAMRAGDTAGTLVTLDATDVSFGDGLAIRTMHPASVRVDWAAAGVSVERGQASDGSTADALELRLPAALGPVDVTVDGVAIWTTDDQGQAVGCSSAFETGPCAARPETLGFDTPVLQITAGASTALSATVFDQYGSALPAATVAYSADAAAGSTTGTTFTAGTTAGAFDRGLHATAGGAAASADVIVAPAAASAVTMSGPESVAAGSAFAVDAVISDSYGNVVTGPITYSAGAGAVHIAGQGFVADTVAGDYAEALVATHGGLSVNRALTVVPASAAALAVVPTQLTLAPGATATLTA
ncbi:MAG: hypothetical protein ACI9MR_001705 [Myxococcota bacterium]|jgi:hypothetical protein